jgi:uncharacterized membrane protein
MIYEGFEDDKVDKNVSAFTIGIILGFIYIIWVFTGVLAFITSLICFAFHGTMSDKFLGLSVALVIGPFYWLYFIFNNTGYCSRSPPTAF